MAKIIITRNGRQMGEVPLTGARLTVGRGGECEITLADPGVSRRHATLTPTEGRYLLQDLGSTNGTFLDDQRVSSWMLRDADELRIGDFVLRYIEMPASVFSHKSDSEMTPAFPPGKAVNLPRSAKLRFFRGEKAGLSERVDGGLYTIGSPGGQLAAITRRPQGFFLLPIGGDCNPRINSRRIVTARAVKLEEGDVLEVGDCLAEITFA